MDETELGYRTQTGPMSQRPAKKPRESAIEQKRLLGTTLVDGEAGEVDLGMREISTDTHFLQCNETQARVLNLFAQDLRKLAPQLGADTFRPRVLLHTTTHSKWRAPIANGRQKVSYLITETSDSA